jgi:uncharacterized protein YdaU (DUF1376 family)
LNYYPFHIGDYLAATRHLSWEEDAAYRRLLDVYYTTEKPLPADLRAVCRLVLATTDSQREAVRVVLEEFFEEAKDGWMNSRADAEIEVMRSKQEKQRERANKRWHKPSAEPGNALAMPRHLESDAAASKTDANAMPPTPTPTPTPRQAKGKTPSESGRGSRLPSDWDPGQTGLAFAASQGLTNGVVTAELEKFRDHWAAKTGPGSTKADWQAAWRNWCRRSIEMRPASHGGRPSGGLPFDASEIR